MVPAWLNYLVSRHDFCQADEEMGIFQAFLKACRLFSTDVVEITQPCQSFPDITVKLQRGSEIDFELGEWLDEERMRVAKKTERLESSLMEALGEQELCHSNHFSCVMLVLRDHPSRFNSQDGGPFRSELLSLTEDTDRRWPNERFWHSPQGHVCRKFELYPTSAKFLRSIHFYPLRLGNELEEPWPVDHP